ncbi:MAG: hypothetical protein A3G96_01665 [Gammaproteobacteria bacterium RIFCSPLOWO2_12_FULL_52_10]|nr:MAG: hypothetical protein A3G96_01665 [Gammaproteobacteria bacterium RIFCSPLOWO2_12_FULL_52_10]
MKNSFFKTMILTLLSSQAVPAQDAPADVNAGQTDLIEKLAARVQYLEDIIAIQQLQSKYTQLLFTQDYAKIIEQCFAKKAEGIEIEFSDSGVYRGIDGVKRLYTAFEATKQIPGFFTMHLTVNPYIVIARDGQSARSSWMSPGATASSAGARWVWGPYYVDYIREDGEWRIHKTKFVPLFRNRYENSWVQETDHGSVRSSLSVEPDAPPTLYKPYDSKQTDLFKDFPGLPEPY